MQERASSGVAFSHMSVTASLSVLILIAVLGYEAYAIWYPRSHVQAAALSQQSAVENDAVQSLAAEIASSSDPIEGASTAALAEVMGAYAGLQSGGDYNPQTATAIAASIGSSLSAPISYKKYAPSDIPTDPDTSYKGMMRYRSALQTSLKPLLANKDSEFELFADYVANADQKDLDELEAAAGNYEAAASSTAMLTVPADAVQYQVGILNAMNEFAATLRAMVAHAEDPLASTMLLTDYNQAQSEMYNAFNALALYEKSKTQ